MSTRKRKKYLVDTFEAQKLATRYLRTEEEGTALFSVITQYCTFIILKINNSSHEIDINTWPYFDLTL